MYCHLLQVFGLSSTPLDKENMLCSQLNTSMLGYFLNHCPLWVESILNRWRAIRLDTELLLCHTKRNNIVYFRVKKSNLQFPFHI
jgi:hypothetical protein